MELAIKDLLTELKDRKESGLPIEEIEILFYMKQAIRGLQFLVNSK